MKQKHTKTQYLFLINKFLYIFVQLFDCGFRKVLYNDGIFFGSDFRFFFTLGISQAIFKWTINFLVALLIVKNKCHKRRKWIANNIIDLKMHLKFATLIILVPLWTKRKLWIWIELIYNVSLPILFEHKYFNQCFSHSRKTSIHVKLS